MDKHLIQKIIVFLALFFLFFILVVFGAFSNIQSGITDKLHGSGSVLDNIIIIKIDDKSINEIGRWPWDRDVFAQILSKVKNADIIGMDLSFFEETGQDFLLNKTLQGMDNVVLAAEISEGTFYKPVFDADYGYVNLISDSDGLIRSVRTDAKEDVLPFSFQIYSKIRGYNPDSFNSVERINFAASPGKFSSLSVKELLESNYSDFRNKIVLVGVTAPDLHDVHMVPTSEGIAMSGVEIQAHILQNLILDSFVAKQKSLITLFFVFIIGLLGMLFLSRLKIHYTILTSLLVIVVYSFIGIFLFQQFNYITDFFFFPLSLIVFTGTGIGMNYIEERKQNLHLINAFGKYVNKDLLDEIIRHKKQLNLGGEKRELTLFFSDIRGFTGISEKLSPEELGSFINEYLTQMTRIILEYRGTIDKFIGDAIMAFWNAPLEEKNHSLLACKSSIAQLKALEDLNKEFTQKKLPPLKIGCGIHTGEAFVGNFGSEDRFDYTALGDTVNIASRLEGLTKYYGVDIIISESTYALVKNHLDCRKLDLVKVKGKKKPLTIYELCTEKDERFIKQYEKALELYFKREFRKAQEEFRKAQDLEKEDVSCQLFLKHCEEYIKSPPERDWDGAFEMKTK